MLVKVNFLFASVILFVAQVSVCSVVTVSLCSPWTVWLWGGGGSQYRLNSEISLLCKCNTYDFNKLQIGNHKRERCKSIYFLNALSKANSKIKVSSSCPWHYLKYLLPEITSQHMQGNEY